MFAKIVGYCIIIFYCFSIITTSNLTIFFQFDLVCDNSNMAEFLQTLVMAGQLVGAVCASSLSDRVGRKTVHLCSNFLTLIFGISVAFAPNYTTLAVLKFILGVLQQVGLMEGFINIQIMFFPYNIG